MKKILMILSALAFLLTAAACQPTPEEVIVVEKDTDRLIEQAQEQPKEQTVPSGLEAIGIPQERVTNEESMLEGKLRIVTDAEVRTPRTETMPIVKVSQDIFTQDQVTGMFHALYPDDPPIVQLSQVETKKDFELYILELKKQYSEGQYQGTEEEYNEELKQLEEFWAEAPAEQPRGTESDGKMMRVAGDWVSLHVADDSGHLWIDTYSTPRPSQGMFSSMGSLNYYSDRSYSHRNMIEYDPSAPPPEAQNVKISYEDAAALGNAFLAESALLPEGSFCIDQAYVVDNAEDGDASGDRYAYLLRYAKCAEGIPVYSFQEYTPSIPTDQYILTWSYEYLEIIIDENGIANIEWMDPIKIGEIVEDDAAMITFDKVMGVFHEIAGASYAPIAQDVFGEGYSMELCAEDIELCLLRVRDQGAEVHDGLLVPAWIFRGHCAITNSAGETRYMKDAPSMFFYQRNNSSTLSKEEEFSSLLEEAGEAHTLITINAIDGSVIDLSKGY